MAGGSRDVDQLWAALKKQTAASATRRSGTLSGLAGLPGVTSRVRVVGKHARGAAPARPSFISQLGQGPRPDGAQTPTSSDHQALLVSAAAACSGLTAFDRRLSARRHVCCCPLSVHPHAVDCSRPAGLAAARYQRPERPRPLHAPARGAARGWVPMAGLCMLLARAAGVPFWSQGPSKFIYSMQLEKLHAALLGPPGAPPDALAAALAGPLLVPLVRLLADPAEKCRELAAVFFAAALPRLPAPGGAAPLLPTLVPALAERVGTPPVQEPSEEMRLALAELVAGPLLGAAAACASDSALPAELLAPLAATVCCQLQDPFADIKKVGRCWQLGGEQRQCVDKL